MEASTTQVSACSLSYSFDLILVLPGIKRKLLERENKEQEKREVVSPIISPLPPPPPPTPPPPPPPDSERQGAIQEALNAFSTFWLLSKRVLSRRR
ncbi:hypothetical protein LguiB_009762 [Lonicera macranthoides]